MSEEPDTAHTSASEQAAGDDLVTAAGISAGVDTDLPEFANTLSEISESLEEVVLAAATEELVRAIAVRAVRSHSGPLPSPDDFAHYAATLPSAPERIMGMAERSHAHLIRQQDRQTRVDAAGTIVGLIFAFFLAALVLGGSVWLVHDGHGLAGTVLATVDLVALATVFVLGKDGMRPGPPGGPPT